MVGKPGKNNQPNHFRVSSLEIVIAIELLNQGHLGLDVFIEGFGGEENFLPG